MFTVPHTSYSTEHCHVSAVYNKVTRHLEMSGSLNKQGFKVNFFVLPPYMSRNTEVSISRSTLLYLLNSEIVHMYRTAYVKSVKCFKFFTPEILNPEARTKIASSHYPLFLLKLLCWISAIKLYRVEETNTGSVQYNQWNLFAFIVP